MERLRAKKGAGLRILTEAVGSPSLAGQIKDLLAALPEAKWHRYEPVNSDNARAGAKLAFGEYVDPVYHFDRADVILSLDADFLACGSPGRIADERAFAARRDPKDGAMNRLYVAEAAFTNTGASADHRLPIRPSQIVDLALAVAREAGVEGVAAAAGLTEPQAKFAAAVGKDLKAHKGQGPGPGRRRASRPTSTPWATRSTRPSGRSGPRGRSPSSSRSRPTRSSTSPRSASWSRTWRPARSRRSLILGGNPAYTAPADLEFARALVAAVDPSDRNSAARCRLDPPGPARRRDLGALHLARPRGPLPGVAGATPGPSTAPRRSSSR